MRVIIWIWWWVFLIESVGGDENLVVVGVLVGDLVLW